jgi:hypothetical protein
MGDLAGVSLHADANDHCSKCGKSGRNCCKDEVIFCKADVKHQTVSGQQTLLPATKFLHLPVIIFPVPVINHSISFVTYNDHAPPDRSSLYIKYCTYRI